jgi:hypothetical protein
MSEIILVGHQMRGSETIQAQKWHTWITKDGQGKSLTPFYVPESTSLAHAQHQAFIYFRQHPDMVDRWLKQGWSVHHMPAETGIVMVGETVIQEGA